MAIAASLRHYLNSQQVEFHLLKHRPTPNLQDTARDARLPPATVARALLLRDAQQHYFVALIPSNSQLDLNAASACAGAQLEICPTPQAQPLFGDCHPGITPPFGAPYQLTTLVDHALLQPPTLYLEDGDPTELIRLEQSAFQRLIGKSPVAKLSRASH